MEWGFFTRGELTAQENNKGIFSPITFIDGVLGKINFLIFRRGITVRLNDLCLFFLMIYLLSS